MAIKVDMKRAYDMMIWDYLEEILLRFSFRKKIIALIIWVYTQTILLVPCNGFSLLLDCGKEIRSRYICSLVRSCM